MKAARVAFRSAAALAGSRALTVGGSASRLKAWGLNLMVGCCWLKNWNAGVESNPLPGRRGTETMAGLNPFSFRAIPINVSNVMKINPRLRRLIGLAAVFLLWLSAGTAQAGMTVYDLTDVARLRLEDISFFLFLLLLAALGIRLLWNFFARDFPRLPRLSFFKAICLTGLLSLFMLLILVMISGARELLTPGAWHRQSSHYRPNDVGNSELRQQSMAALRVALI